jgi:hypothetical protein
MTEPEASCLWESRSGRMVRHALLQGGIAESGF